MKTYIALLSLALLAGCGSSEEPAPPPMPTETATPDPVNTLPAPDTTVFGAVFGEACPKAEKVNTSVCKRAGLGSDDFVCEYGLGKDEYLRHKATITPGDGKWVLKDPETVCTEHAND